MKKLFVETKGFTSRVVEVLSDDDYRKLQQQLSDDPECGVVMRGCGGLRKIRWYDPRRQKGKRGGIRIIYLHVDEADWIYLLDLYDKGEREDLNAKERKALRILADISKKEAIRKSGGKS